jgi:hypothetical protein
MKRWQGRVSQLVAFAFLGPCPPGHYVCHNDGNPKNNHPCNLRYDTPTGNMADCLKHGTRLFGERNPNSKLCEEEVLALRQRWAEGGVTNTQLAREFGVSRSTARYAVLRKSWPQI